LFVISDIIVSSYLFGFVISDVNNVDIHDNNVDM